MDVTKQIMEKIEKWQIIKIMYLELTDIFKLTMLSIVTVKYVKDPHDETRVYINLDNMRAPLK